METTVARTSARWGGLLAALLLAGAPAAAQEYPSRPVRIVVPFSPGGAVDGPMRAIAQVLSRRFGQQVSIDNNPGAGAPIGSEVVARAPADGYTLLLASQTNAISATLYTRLGFNPVDDFVGISLLGREPAVLVVHPSLPVKSVAELLAYGRQRPGEPNYASSGNGSGQHLFMVQQKNYLMAYQILHAYFTQPAPAYVSSAHP